MHGEFYQRNLKEKKTKRGWQGAKINVKDMFEDVFGFEAQARIQWWAPVKDRNFVV
jgi:hypothetical protein